MKLSQITKSLPDVERGRDTLVIVNCNNLDSQIRLTNIHLTVMEKENVVNKCNQGNFHEDLVAITADRQSARRRRILFGPAPILIEDT